MELIYLINLVNAILWRRPKRHRLRSIQVTHYWLWHTQTNSGRWCCSRGRNRNYSRGRNSNYRRCRHRLLQYNFRFDFGRRATLNFDFVNILFMGDAIGAVLKVFVTHTALELLDDLSPVSMQSVVDLQHVLTKKIKDFIRLKCYAKLNCAIKVK